MIAETIVELPVLPHATSKVVRVNLSGFSPFVFKRSTNDIASANLPKQHILHYIILYKIS